MSSFRPTKLLIRPSNSAWTWWKLLPMSDRRYVASSTTASGSTSSPNRRKNEKPKSREKEVKFRVNIGDPHDYSDQNDPGGGLSSRRVTRCECSLQFRGRQMAHKDLGFDLMNRVKEDLQGVAHVDLEPKLNARNILMMLVAAAGNSSRFGNSAPTTRSTTSISRPTRLPRPPKTITTKMTITIWRSTMTPSRIPARMPKPKPNRTTTTGRTD